MATILEVPKIQQREAATPVAIPLFQAGIGAGSISQGAAQALEGTIKQMNTTALEPLLYGAKLDELSATFVRLYHRFAPVYLSALTVLAEAFERDPQRLAALAAHGFAEAHRTLRSRGPERIGQEATTAALIGLDTMARIIRRAISTPADGTIGASEHALNQWAPLALAYQFALAAIMSFLSRDEQLRAGAENARTLALWSKAYAVQVFHLSKQLGLLPAASARRPIPNASDEEDLLLANAGLAEYWKLLDHEEDASHGGQR